MFLCCLGGTCGLLILSKVDMHACKSFDEALLRTIFSQVVRVGRSVSIMDTFAPPPYCVPRAPPPSGAADVHVMTRERERESHNHQSSLAVIISQRVERRKLQLPGGASITMTAGTRMSFIVALSGESSPPAHKGSAERMDAGGKTFSCVYIPVTQ